VAFGVGIQSEECISSRTRIAKAVASKGKTDKNVFARSCHSCLSCSESLILTLSSTTVHSSNMSSDPSPRGAHENHDPQLVVDQRHDTYERRNLAVPLFRYLSHETLSCEHNSNDRRGAIALTFAHTRDCSCMTGSSSIPKLAVHAVSGLFDPGP
jgi:hypothetical protein